MADQITCQWYGTSVQDETLGLNRAADISKGTAAFHKTSDLANNS